MIGLDAAGKTTILYQLSKGEPIRTISNNGFHAEKLIYQNLIFINLDLLSNIRLKHIWKDYFKISDAIIFIVDSNDEERIEKVSEELKKILSAKELNESVLLVLANKQDVNGAMSSEEISLKLGLSQ
jgi:GTPase SAR1 family protein